MDDEDGAASPLLVGRTPRGLLLTLAAASSAGGAIYGYNVAAGAYLDAVGDALSLSTAGTQAVSSAATLTDAIAMLAGGTLFLDRWGRRKTALLGAAFNVCGCLAAATATSLAWLLVGRLTQGVGNGVSMLAVPMLVSEVAPLRHRGALVSCFQVGVVVGFTLPYVFQLASGAWQLTVVCGAAPGAVLGAALLYLGPHLELAACRPAGGETVLEDVLEDRLEEASVSALEPGEEDDEIISFRGGALLSIVMAMMNNSSDAIVFYGPQIMERAGLGGEKSLWTALMLSALNIPAAVLVLAIVHRFPRRRLLLGGIAVIVCCYGVLGLLFTAHWDGHYAVVVLTMLVLMVAFQAGPGTLFVVVLPELFSHRRRAQGMAVGTVSMSVFSILCNGTMLSTMEALGTGPTFLAYGGLYAVCLAVLARFMPESRGVKVL